MDRIRPLPWPAALAVLALSIGTLGDACPVHSRPATAPAKPSAAALAQPAAPAAAASAATPVPAAPTPAGPTFEATVRPILAVRCAPCHNPGGKMYGRLPFDQPAVVSSHADGVRRRLKGEDLLALEKWLATLPPVQPSGDPWPGRGVRGEG